MKITALVSAGRLFLSDRYGYRFYVTLQRNKKHDNQFNHTSHLLSDGVLTAACPVYYTWKYYSATVLICRIKNFLTPPGVDKGAHPLMFIPALATGASKRIKTEGFCTLRVLPPGNEVRGKTRKPSVKWLCHFTERRQPQYLLQFRNKKPLTSVTIGGNI